MEIQMLLDRRVQLLDGEGNIRSLGDIEKEIIVVALQHYRGRVSEAARRLKMSRSTLYRKMQSMNIRQPEFQPMQPHMQAQEA